MMIPESIVTMGIAGAVSIETAIFDSSDYR
jgi:hypothetical protein